MPFINRLSMIFKYRVQNRFKILLSILGMYLEPKTIFKKFNNKKQKF